LTRILAIALAEKLIAHDLKSSKHVVSLPLRMCLRKREGLIRHFDNKEFLTVFAQSQTLYLCGRASTEF